MPSYGFSGTRVVAIVEGNGPELVLSVHFEPGDLCERLNMALDSVACAEFKRYGGYGEAIIVVTPVEASRSRLRDELKLWFEQNMGDVIVTP
jgi:hypothetical protein